MVLPGSRRLRQHLGDGTSGGVVGSITLGDGPVQNGFHALTYPAGRLRFFRPDRGQDIQDVGGGDFGDQLGPDSGEDIGGQGTGPLGGMLGVRPARATHFDDRLPRFGEGRSGGSPAGCNGLTLFSQRAATLPDHPGVDQGSRASLRQRNCRIAAEAQVPSFSVNGNPLEPVFGPGFFYPEIEASAVRIGARFLNGLNENRRKGVALAFGVMVPRPAYTNSIPLF